MFDVVIAGAGPAGSTAASLIAEAGFRVLVLEKHQFPRFHIGESLLPAAFAMPGVSGIPSSRDAAVFKHKRGAQFVCERTGRMQTFDFADAVAGPPRHASHVDRALFDKMLCDHAQEAGAEVRHGVGVNSVTFGSSDVLVQTGEGEERARYFVDATGQDRLLAKKHRSVVPYRHFGKAAVFSHFDGISVEALSDFEPNNDIRIMMVEEGWAWVIPLPGDRLSVGLVSREPGIDHDALARYIGGSPLLQRWTEGAAASEPTLIANFSYRNALPAGERYVCLGDAACFIDPVFSSGVSLAMRSALQACSSLIGALRSESEGAPDLMASVGREMERGYETFASLVYRFYNTNFVQHFVFGAPDEGPLRSEVVSVLGGDVFRAGNRFQDMLLSTRKKPWLEREKAMHPLAEL